MIRVDKTDKTICCRHINEKYVYYQLSSKVCDMLIIRVDKISMDNELITVR